MGQSIKPTQSRHQIEHIYNSNAIFLGFFAYFGTKCTGSAFSVESYGIKTGQGLLQCRPSGKTVSINPV